MSEEIILEYTISKKVSPSFVPLFFADDLTSTDELIGLFGGSPTLSLDSLSLSTTSSPSPLPPTDPTPTTAPTTTTLTTISPTTAAAIAPYQLNLIQVGIDRRLLLNRKLQLKMYRIWLQGRWQKSL